ncbi:MAG: hypothetical protein ACKV1O_07440 [Saprospiraceae bacterium]
MKVITPLAFCLLALTPLFAQQDLKLPGIVVEQNSKYKTGKVAYLGQVSIRSIPSTTPTRSDSNGAFMLVFADYRGGSNVRVIASKQGYEVVNQKELENAAVLGRYEPLKIVMCKAGELANNQVKYYNIGVEAITDSYKKKIALLDKNSKEKDAMIAELRQRHGVLLTEKASILYYLEKDKAEALAQVRSFSERFAEINLDDADSLYIAAYNAYMEKRIEDVFQILDLQLLEKNMEAAKRMITQGTDLIAYADSVKKYNLQMLEQFTKGSWLAADAATQINALSKAQQYYEQSLSATPCNIQTRYLYAQFLADYSKDPALYLNNLEKAVQCLETIPSERYAASFFHTLHLRTDWQFLEEERVELIYMRLKNLIE